MRRLRLYLETTAFNYFFDADRKGHQDVVRLFEAIAAGSYEGYVSRYVVEELGAAPEPKRTNMLALIDRYHLITLWPNPIALRLAERYIANGIIPASHIYDSVHIAMASVHGLDCVVSYNFKHINRSKTRLLTRSINDEEGYDGIIICILQEAAHAGGSPAPLLSAFFRC